jgi:hypothetical protein
VISESGVRQFCVSTKFTLKLRKGFSEIWFGVRHQNTLENYVEYCITLYEDRMEDFRFLKTVYFSGTYIYIYIVTKRISV